MREIKFRAWDKVAKQMSPEFVLFGEFMLLGAVHDWQWEILGKGPEEIKDYSSLLRLNDLEIMQFTGLKDKNGKEIFEGDIMKHPIETNWFAWFIEFHGACFCLRNIGVDGYLHEPMYLTEDRVSEREIVGNIYENPDLL